MADGARFDINIEASSLGVDSTASELNTLVERMTKANTVATQFDSVVAAARARLDEATAAATAAAGALGAAEGRYKELESAANKAAKEVEKAAVAGKDTTALQAAASAAAAKMHEQASAVDELRTKSLAAAKAQDTLKGTLKALEGQQATAAAAVQKKAVPAVKDYSAALTAGAVAAGAMVVGAAAGVIALAKFGFGILSNAANMMRLTLAQQRMQLGMQRLFKGLQWDKFTRGLEDIMTLFDEGTSSANGMKKLIETVLQPLIDGAVKAAPLVKEMFKGLIYGALQVAIAVLKVRNAIWFALSPETRSQIKAVSDEILTLKNAFTVGETAAKVLAVAAVALGVAFAVGMIPVILLAITIQRVIDIAEWLGDSIGDVVDAIGDAIDGLSDWVDSAATAASDMIDGLVNGIKKGIGKVVAAVKGLASSAIQAFTGKDGIDAHSPSKVFELRGHWSGEGYAQGVDKSAGLVEDAMVSMASPPDFSVTAPASTPAPSGGSPRQSIVIQSLTIGSDPVSQSNLAQFKQMLLEVFEGASITIGGGEAAAA
ncbi:MAG: hypothetical protein KBD62_35925 [Kofleriaceae bacterium]|nr:hypothetical protein [Kofleriaceae bacterium]